MGTKRELFPGLKDWFQRHRNGVAYTFVLLALFGALAGWALLPDRVTMEGNPPPGMEPLYRPKNVLLLVHLAMTGFFTGLYWKWPRQLAYVFGMVMGLVFTYGLLLINLVH